MTACNPILPGFNPDPSIVRVGTNYFCTTSSFEYFPGLPIYHSTDLVNWKLIGHALNRRSQLDMRTVEPGGGVYAPSLRFWKGRFYMSTCVLYLRSRVPPMSHPRGFYVSTDNIWDESTWSDPIYFDMAGIDQDLFFDTDDKVYVCVARRSEGPAQAAGSKLITYGCQIDLATGNNLTRPRPLRVSPVVNGVAEGPHIYRYGGWYYLSTAEGGTGVNHQQWITRSRSPLGPYEDAPSGVNPLVFNGENPDVKRTGHMDFVQAPDGKWWAVMLAVRPQANGLAHLGRETWLAPVEWEEGGWPKVNGGKPIGAVVPAVLPQMLQTRSWRDNFDQVSLSLGWYHLRTPFKPIHNFHDRPGCLTIISNSQAIHQLESPAMLLRKQTALRGSWSTSLHFDPEDEFEEAGSVVYYSNISYGAILIKRRGGERVVLARWTDYESRTTKEAAHPIPPSGPVTLVIQADATEYRLRYRTASQETFTELVKFSSLVLDGGGGQEFQQYFTGTHFGLFNQATDGEWCRTPAHFEWAEFAEDHE